MASNATKLQYLLDSNIPLLGKEFSQREEPSKVLSRHEGEGLRVSCFLNAGQSRYYGERSARDAEPTEGSKLYAAVCTASGLLSLLGDYQGGKVGMVLEDLDEEMVVVGDPEKQYVAALHGKDRKAREAVEEEFPGLQYASGRPQKEMLVTTPEGELLSQYGDCDQAVGSSVATLMNVLPGQHQTVRVDGYSIQTENRPEFAEENVYVLYGPIQG